MNLGQRTDTQCTHESKQYLLTIAITSMPEYFQLTRREHERMRRPKHTIPLSGCLDIAPAPHLPSCVLPTVCLSV